MGLVLRELGNEYCVWDALMQIAAEYPIKNYLEIGTRYGDSLLRVLCSRKLEQICIADVWHESYFGGGSGCGVAFAERGHKHIERMLTGLGYDCAKQVTWLDGDSAKTIPLLNPKVNQFDLVLVDGDHDPIPARTDLFNAWPLVAPGGFLVFDDILDVQHMMELWTMFHRNTPEIHEVLIRTDKKFGVAVASKQSHYLETSKVRKRILDRYPDTFGGNPDTHGDIPGIKGIDVGCSRDPLTRTCVAFDQSDWPEVSERGDARALPFKDGQFDWLWSSHCLEDFEDTQAVLKEWLRVVKPGGMVGLYVPHPELYKGTNTDHKHPGFTPETLTAMLTGLRCTIIETGVDDFPTGPQPRYSSLVIARKLL